MSDELLSYYERELAYLRKQGAEFADRHPKIASRLRLSGDAVEDPHIDRLQQGVAFLNARLRKKLDDEFPELTEGMLGHLYPHYLAPIPSMAIVQFQPASDLVDRKVVPALAEIVTEPVLGERCRFRTTMPVEILPIRIENVALSGRPLIGPAKPDGSMGVLRLTLKTQSKTVAWDKLHPDQLRFFLRGPSNEALRLYELILNDVSRVRSVVIADSPDDHQPLVLDASAIQPVGFEADEGIIPYSPRSPKGYRLLTEYFSFPEKFWFFDIKGIAEKTRQIGGETLEIFIYVDRWSADLERAATKDSLALGCTPMVNLFSQRVEPIALTESSVEYQITPDSRRPGALEVYSVDKVTIASQTGETVTLHPLFGLTHTAASRGDTRFWHATRRPSDDGASDTFLSLVDLDGDPFSPSDWVASIEATCTNRELAGKLPFGGGHPHLRLNREQPGVGTISCLVAPRAPLRLPNRKQSAWRLISHLTLNHLSLIDQDSGPTALREILRLYDFRDAAETRAIIDSMTGIEFRRGTARAPTRQMGVLCRGLDITLEFDEQAVSGVGIFLFASVLERFIAHYASINAFTRLTAKVKGRSGVLRTWPPRAGDLKLL